MLYSIEAGVNAPPHPTSGEEFLLGKKAKPFERNRRGLPADVVSIDGLAVLKDSPAPLRGLGATIPHGANYTAVTSGQGSGGIRPADAGGGGGGGSVPGGSSSIALTTPPSGRVLPVGRNTSPYAGPGQKGEARRVRFQPTSQGARVSRGEAISPITPRTGSNYPAGGLFGVSDGLSGVDGFFGDVGRWFSARLRPRRRSSPASAPRPTYAPPPPGMIGVSGLSGTDDFFGDVGRFVSRAVRPPKTTGNIIKIAAAPFTAGLSLVAPRQWFTPPSAINRPLQAGVDNFIRPAIRYTGLATATVLTGGFMPLSAPRKLFGLSADEAKYTEIGLKTARGITTLIFTAGMAKWYMTPKMVASAPGLNTAVGPTPAGLNLIQTTSPFGNIAASTPSGFATPAQIAGASSHGLLSQGGSLLLSGAKFVGSTVSSTLLPIMALKALGGGGQGGQAPSQDSGGNSVVVGQPQQDPNAGAGPAFGASGGFGGGGSDSAPILASPSPVMMIAVGGLLVTGAVMFFKRKR